MSIPFATGIDALLNYHCDWLEGARVGLIAHRASLTGTGIHTAARLRRKLGRQLCALFGPEHGWLGMGGAGERIHHARHPHWDIPIYSLYGDTRRPTEEMLRSLDVLVFDLQDLAVRCYTYVSTLRYLLEAAALHGKTVIVADRPIPFANTIDGPMMETSLTSFVGCIPAPLVYGMTPCETAVWLRAVLHLDVDLRVARMIGYRRETTRPRAAPAWVPPSPAIRTWRSAWAYPTMVWTEAFPAITCGRRGRTPFQVATAPGLDGKALCRALKQTGLRGARFHALDSGIRFEVTEPDLFRPVETGVAVLAAIRDTHGAGLLWEHPRARPQFFDQLIGGRGVRNALARGDAADAIARAWRKPVAAFANEREAARLYAAPVKHRPKLHRVTTAQRPTKAIVLAAGYGTRMRPLSNDLAKPLMPLWGKPMLQHTFELLAAWGVKDVVVNCHHAAADVVQFLSRPVMTGLRIQISFEPTILGTGGAIRQAQWFLDERPFWMINADVAADLSPEPLIRDFHHRRALATLWLHPLQGPRTVEANAGRIVTFRSKHPGSRGTHTFCGLQLLSPSILNYLPPSGFASVIAAYEEARRKGQTISGVSMPDVFWADIGTPEQYVDAHDEVRTRFQDGRPGGRLYDPHAGGLAQRLRRQGVNASGFVSAAPGVRVAPGASCRDCVLWAGAQIGKRAVASRAIVGRGATVTGDAGGMAVLARHALSKAALEALRSIGWDPGSVTATPLGARGSGRMFTRVSARNRRMVLIEYEAERRENRFYAGHARFLEQAGIPVPHVVLHDPKQRLLFMTDLGTQSLERVARTASDGKVRKIYEDILRSVTCLHGAATRAAKNARLRLMPPFTRSLFASEVDLFCTHFLRRYLRLSEQTAAYIRRDMEGIYGTLLDTPRVLLHRDLQSSNIFLLPRGHAFIDFQGMRYGPAAYDLASLLCDPYVGLSLDKQETLLTFYTEIGGVAYGGRTTFWRAAVQRLTQALGAYVRLSRIPGMNRYERYIPPALRMLRRALAQTSGADNLRRMAEGVDI